MTYVEITIRVVLTLVLSAAVVGKLHSGRAFRQFRDSLLELPWLPVPRGPAAVAVVVAETSVVILLWAPETTLVGLLAAGGLFGTLAAGVGAALRSGGQLRCHCFGRAGPVMSWGHLIRLLALVALSLGGAACATFDAGTPQPLGAVLAGLAGLALATVVVWWDDLAFLFSPRSDNQDARSWSR